MAEFTDREPPTPRGSGLNARRDDPDGPSPLAGGITGPRRNDYPEREPRGAATEPDLAAMEGGARSGARTARRGAALDPATRRLALGAAGIGGFLVLLVGGWSLVGHRGGGIPVIEAPTGPIRVKPVDPGGMQVLGAQMPSGDGGVQGLAPGPEQPRPEALQAEVDAARHEAAEQTHPGPSPVAGTAGAPALSLGARQAETAAAPPTAATMSHTQPQPPVSERVETAHDDTPREDNAVKVPPASLPASGEAVQLAALDSEQAALSAWTRMAQAQPGLLHGHRPLVERTTCNGHVFYRLRTSGFATIADATAFCAKLHAAGMACTLASF